MFVVLFTAGVLLASAQSKTIAVTIDDLPLNIASRVSNGEMKSIVERLLKNIQEERIPVTAFVNEGKLAVNGARDPERVAILKLWFDAGVELGNHTYAHKSQNQATMAEAKNDILRGERTIKELLAARNKRPEYFRHPYLQTGRDSVTRAVLTRFLDSLGYSIVPVTIDNSEWLFAAAFDNVYAQNDSAAMKKIGDEYISYMRSKLRFYERISDSLFGRQIHQILLIHSNRLNSLYFSALCTMIKEEGYRFTDVKTALTDEAYRSPDTYYGPAGISWLDRWALTRGKRGSFFRGDPEAPQHIKEIAGFDYE